MLKDTESASDTFHTDNENIQAADAVHFAVNAQSLLGEVSLQSDALPSEAKDFSHGTEKSTEDLQNALLAMEHSVELIRRSADSNSNITYGDDDRFAEDQDHASSYAAAPAESAYGNTILEGFLHTVSTADEVLNELIADISGDPSGLASELSCQSSSSHSSNHHPTSLPEEMQAGIQSHSASSSAAVLQAPTAASSAADLSAPTASALKTDLQVPTSSSSAAHLRAPTASSQHEQHSVARDFELEGLLQDKPSRLNKHGRDAQVCFA